MSKIKDLFTEKKNKILPAKSKENIVTGSGVESAGYIESTDRNILRFLPKVDYTQPEFFARYGSAEKYYEDSINYIIRRYPYDGSAKEKKNWQLSSSYFDNYIFEKEYPRTNGFINLGINYGTTGSNGADGYEEPTINEYISFKGGPHTSSAGMTGKPLARTFSGSNYYNASQRETNLDLHPANGNTVEFWFKKTGYNSVSESSKQVFLDIWNSASLGSNYGRFRIQCDFATTPHQFSLVYQSGTTDGFLDTSPATIGQNINLTSSAWNHYAFTFANQGSSLEAKLYVNGVYNSTATTSSVGRITGSLYGYLGAMTTGISSPVTGATGYAKLSGSYDEFRFWKTKRTETDIGRYWFTQVGAGTNTDDANTKLGVYYKFNEGIVNTASVDTLDAKVLDYSGRITNGNWTGYTTGSRDTGSAIVIAEAATSEFQDPIIYERNPRVSNYKGTKTNIGFDYDVRNNSGIYSSIPEYITNDPSEAESQNVKKLTQIIGSYFDNLHLQIESLPEIKDVQYTSGSQKVAPFVNRFLEGLGLYAPEIFADASALEYYASRDDYIEFSKKLNDTKNRIYENIYNNITHIYKTKGTEESFRNLMRCYGVDEPLMKISIYGDETTQPLRTNSRNTAERKIFADFNDPDRFDSTVYQQTASSDTTNTRNFISASSDMQYIPRTMQAEIIFPKKLKTDSTLYFPTTFLTSSLFGGHTPLVSDQTDLTWNSNDISNFQVCAVRTEREGDDVYFKLTGSAGGIFPEITSSVYRDVYDNTKWNLAVRVKPNNYYVPGLSGSAASASGSIEFIGYNTDGDNVEQSFHLSQPISMTSIEQFLTSSIRVYAGCHRQNFTGSQLQQTDVKISSVRYWIDELTNEEIEAHSKDASSYGRLEPHKSAYLVKNSSPYFDQVDVPRSETLALFWGFDQVTGSGASSAPTVSDATYFVADQSSGSSSDTSLYGWVGPITNFRHPGKGDFYLGNDTNAVNTEYVFSAKQLAPDIMNSSNMIEILDQDDDLFTRETRPQNYFYAIEKSQAGIISEQMMRWFATIKDFNFLIGNPINRYRQQYKALANMREMYFRSVGNTIDFERFVEYFKWVDNSLSDMLLQLVPASANFSDKIRNMVESHVLERNKYWSKFPTLEMKIDDPEAGLRGIVEGTYPWSRGHASIPLAQDVNCFWSSNRADASVFSSGDTNVDAARNVFREAKDFRNDAAPTLTDISSGARTQYQASTYAIRNFTKPYNLEVDKQRNIKGGSNTPAAKKTKFAHTDIKLNRDAPGMVSRLRITASSISYEKDCSDVSIPNQKKRLEGAFIDATDADPARISAISYNGGKSTMFAPFTLFSSSITPSYLSGFRANTQLANYHDDSYGEESEVPMQGPFTDAHVGGWQYRHQDINEGASDTSKTRAEAWDVESQDQRISIISRRLTSGLPRGNMLRDTLAKRPINIANLKWGTSSAVAGNYRQDYEIIQTSGRKLNNRFFVKNEGFIPQYSASAYVAGLIDYKLPDYNEYGSTKFVFVERFNAPGGPDVSSRGVLDLYAEEYAIGNELNQRNNIVRTPLDQWYTEHCGQFGIKSGSSVRELDYNTLASYHKVNRNPLTIPYEETGTHSCKEQYDNWWVQHSIPRSDYQYAWVTASAVSVVGCNFFAHAGSPNCGRSNFTVPSGSTESVAATDITYTSASVMTGAAGIYVDFVGLNTLINDPIVSVTNTLSSSNGSYINSSIATIESKNELNFLNLHRNGPYQHPSWKQIRGGEHPVARYQKNNNILTFNKQIEIDPNIVIQNQPGAGLTKDSIIQFVEPPVSFRYRPLETTLVLSESDPQAETTVTLGNTYGNNVGGFPNPDINNFLGTSIKCQEQMYDRFRELSDSNSTADPVRRMLSNSYPEILYPREIHAGIKEYRQRTQYAEVANGTPVYSGGKVIFVSASLSNGINGIDRGPRQRRTFWRNDPVYRNRRASHRLTSEYSPIITGTLPNSQGYYDGFATSVNNWGNTPIVFVTSIEGPPNNSTSVSTTLSGSDTGLSLTVLDYPDCGELNSANYPKLVGLAGTINLSYYNGGTNPNPTFPLQWQLTWYPTASCYYYHQHIIGTAGPTPDGNFGTSSLGLKWRVSELSGKEPFFDTYEDYIQDIRGIGKSFSIVPEFRISEHMDYYADGMFRKQNDQFLTLDGAEITASAQQVTQSDGTRGFNDEFFADYSNTDFQKYFGKFSKEDKVNKITLTCNGVKKLLPYHGFYPAHRTLQLATLFSQSIAPHINGIAWSSGSTTDPTMPPSGALAVQSLLQPFYAPGIMYNTIKAGIACDWAAYTGSTTFTDPGTTGNGYILSASNYRIPFEAILDPLSDIGLPQNVNGLNSEQRLNLLLPTYQTRLGTFSAAAVNFGEIRRPYVSISDKERNKALGSKKYDQYRLAMNNFMAEIPSFFLQNSSFKTIVSKQAGEVSLVSGNTYYMNIYLQKDPEVIMIQDYWNGTRGQDSNNDSLPLPMKFTGESEYRSYNGRYFGPAVKAGHPDPVGSSAPIEYWGPRSTRQGDPAYAPYTPPYFYGKSIVTVAYTADVDDEKGGFNFKKVFEKSVLSQTNPQMENMFEVIQSSLAEAPALSSSMPLSSSMNLFGLFAQKQSTFDEAGNLIQVTDLPNSDRNRWVISPKMETPVLDFSTQPEQKGWGRGMWSGYGNVPTGSGISFGIEETYKNTTNVGPTTGSLLQACFSAPESKKIGELAEQKVISEAIVAIPYATRGYAKESRAPQTKAYMDKNFFAIEPEIFDTYREIYMKNKNAGAPIVNASDPSVSIQKMISLMDKYIIPPELDFLTFNQGELKVDPFVMYIFEFNHTLSQQDLSDIWQGVMPDISRIAQLSNSAVDDNVFEHPTGQLEFFGGKVIPEDIRWMVFKVKKRANFDYFKMTADTTDDSKFDFKFNVGGVELPYSYNWPYDYFSLVELAQVEVDTEFREETEAEQEEISPNLRIQNRNGGT